ncbi:MAG: NAD(P)H-hydrate dehydratase [Phaeodactylibacter sp.]|uniref:NAD(P)H-hydrate dehydratase n=1 Tax=Phaeodactylibacter sp. TaxID=1940289 RepID=UPI0032ED631F
MKICSAAQIRELDAYTIEHEPISSLNLMERAAACFTRWLIATYPDQQRPVHIICGIGNNGGDGLAAARLLHHSGYLVTVHTCQISPHRSDDFEANLKRLPGHGAIAVHPLTDGDPMPELPRGALVLDALFGSGLNRPVTGYWGKLLRYLNQLEAERVAIDIPSGVYADQPTEGATFHAHRTFAFELPKLAFLFPENAERVGAWTVGAIGLHPQAIAQAATKRFYLTSSLIQKLLRPRGKFSHKGTHGHALLIVGSYGKMGAALLAARGALRSGAGLVTLHVPKVAYPIVQTALPEAMVSLDDHELQFTAAPDLSPYQAIGVGCGLGQSPLTRDALSHLIHQVDQPLVLDADALNSISKQEELLRQLPPKSILTPHPKEFERLFGPTSHDFQRHELQVRKARELGIIIVLKGAHTCIALPDGRAYFNSTGNAGMATGGSGDVLAGILTGLLAQGYPPEEAALLGVYLHGLAGDCALAQQSQESLMAGDLTEALGQAFKQLHEA